MSEAQDLILAGVLQTPTRTVDIVELDEEFFDGDHRRMFVFLVRYFKKRDRKNAMDLSLARARLERASGKKLAGVLLGFVDEYESYSEITDAEFRDALAELAQERKHKLIKEHAGAAIDSIVEGDYREAEEAMRASLIAIEDAEIDAEPPVNIRSSKAVADARERVRRAHEDDEDEVQSFNIGFEFLTKRVSFRRKELTIFGGFTADGKTQVSKTLVYNANMLSGASVLWVSLEMSKEEMQTLFVAAHAAAIDPKGVRYRQILEGEATEREQKLYDRALADFDVEQHEDTTEITGLPGRLEIWCPNKSPTWDRYQDRARATKREKGLDILALDYLELVLPHAGKSTGHYRLDLKNMINASKALARELDLWHLVLHQISRKGRDEAEKRTPHHYIMQDLGESAGIERAGDTFLWAYYDELLKDDKQCKVGIGKARKGETLIHGRFCYADFAKALVAEIDDEDL